MINYKVSFDINQETVPNYYKKINQILATINVDSNNVLPVPATYLIDRNAKV